MKKELLRFRKRVWNYYRKYGRHSLPWRKTYNLYRILVSEIMLQQTQVERVVPYFRMFLKKFPTIHVLAEASLGEVLKTWQGLGYNRRAKNLHEAAKKLITQNGLPTKRNNQKSNLRRTDVRRILEELESLPGVGLYTARAVAAFAYSKDVAFVETNIRTAVIYHFFSKKNLSIYGGISDKEILRILGDVLPKGKAREWHYALMDYGAYLKRSGVRLNAHAKGYMKQSKFTGSAREARGAILKELANDNTTERQLMSLLGVDRVPQMKSQLATLTKESLIGFSHGKFRLPK